MHRQRDGGSADKNLPEMSGKNEGRGAGQSDKLFHVTGDDFAVTHPKLDEMFQKHLAFSPACAEYMRNLPSIDEVFETLRPHFEANQAARKQHTADNPHNGTLGYWLVSGVRNEARTRAMSAAEAIEKCGAVVQDWEGPEAEFIGVELPDVF